MAKTKSRTLAAPTEQMIAGTLVAQAAVDAFSSSVGKTPHSQPRALVALKVL